MDRDGTDGMDSEINEKWTEIVQDGMDTDTIEKRDTDSTDLLQCWSGQ